MKKALSFIILFGIAVVFGNLVGKADNPHRISAPIIVSSLSFPSQATQFFPQTTVFTPEVTGLYRITVYIEFSSPDGSNSQNPTFRWSDDFNVSQSSNGLFTSSNRSMLGLMTVNAVAGSPITVETGNSLGPSVTYNLFVTVEQL